MAVEERATERIAEVVGARNAADAAAVSLVADVIDSGEWEGEGMATIGGWITWRFGVTRHRAHVFVVVAKRRSELPTAMEMFGQGRLSIEQMFLVAKHCPSEFEASVANFAQFATIAQLSKSLRSYSFDGCDTAANNADGQADDDEPPLPRSRASITFGPDGRFRFTAAGDAEEGARLKAALDQYHTRLVGERPSADAPFPSTFDAFMALVDSSVGADLSTSRRHRHRTLLHIDAETLADWAAGERPALHLGAVVSRATMELLTCDGDVTTLLTHFGKPVRLGRSTRVIPPWLREVIINRDGGCRVCGATQNLDVHHVIHWSNGGATDPSNLVTVCSRCHTAHHKGEITISGEPARTPGPSRSDGLTVTNQHGRRINRVPPPKKPPPDRRPRGQYRHPLGERLRQHDVWFNSNAP